MSEARFSKKQVIEIIAITWVLSLVTTLVVVNFLAPNPKNSWHLVEIYQGTFQGSIDEPDFLYFEPTISADNWRIIWHVNCNQTPPPEDVLFHFTISDSRHIATYPRNYVTKEDFRSYSGEWFEKSEEGIEYFVGSGMKIYLTIRGIKISWKVIIEEYY